MFSVFWFADGAGADDKVPRALVRWIRSATTPADRLIVYGGDVYNRGTEEEFAMFFDQMGRDVSDACAVGGNHDWKTHSADAHPIQIPVVYERFWRQHPESQQPVDISKRGGARYEHVKDIGGWRLVFLDTGPCNKENWPVGDPERATWLKDRLTETPGRAKIVFGHHSRLSRGKHGNNKTVRALWDCLFDDTGVPRAALTVGGHDHNATWYNPRPKDPSEGEVPFDRGIFVHVNGAGGHGHDETSGFVTHFILPITGTKPDFADDDNWCVTRIDLISSTEADVSILSFGNEVPPRVTEPTPLFTFKLRV